MEKARASEERYEDGGESEGEEGERNADDGDGGAGSAKATLI